MRKVGFQVMTVNAETQTTAVPLLRARRRLLLWGLLAITLLAGWGLRLYYITDPPLDFHAQRQYWDANRARLMYYRALQRSTTIPDWQMKIASANADQNNTELPIVESLAVAGYLLAGGEYLAIPRGIVASLYVLGGLFLFLLAARIFSAFPAFVALGYYLFLPFAVQATRTFQPDPLMVMLIVVSLYFLHRYTEEQTLRRLLPAGILTALTVLAKPNSLFFIIVPFALLILVKAIHETKGFKDRKALARVLPLSHVAIFTVLVVLGLSWTTWNYLHGGGVAQQAAKTHKPELFLDPIWWKGYWMIVWGSALQYWALVFGLLGLAAAGVQWARNRSDIRARAACWLLVGGWLGYALYFYAFNYHVQSHIYYNLPMVPIAALSLAALVSAVPGWLYAGKTAQWLAIAGFLGYLCYLFFIKLPIVIGAPPPQMPPGTPPPNPLVATFTPFVPFAALSLAALIAVVAMRLRLRPKSLHASAGVLAGIMLALLLTGATIMIGRTQAKVHPQLADFQRLLEDIGKRVGHTQNAVFLTYGYGDPLKFHGMMGGSNWPMLMDIDVETKLRGEQARTTLDRLHEAVDPGRDYFIVDGTQFQEFEMQSELKKLLLDTYPVLAQPPYSPYWIFDLQHPLKPLPAR